MKDKIKNQNLVICSASKKCNFNCPHKIPHNRYGYCYAGQCSWANNKIGKCIQYKSKKSAKRYSLKQLYNLWIEWVEKYNISCQKFYEEYGLPGSFIKWLEEREKNA